MESEGDSSSIFTAGYSSACDCWPRRSRTFSFGQFLIAQLRTSSQPRMRPRRLRPVLPKFSSFPHPHDWAHPCSRRAFEVLGGSYPFGKGFCLTEGHRKDVGVLSPEDLGPLVDLCPDQHEGDRPNRHDSLHHLEILQLWSVIRTPAFLHLHFRGQLVSIEISGTASPLFVRAPLTRF